MRIAKVKLTDTGIRIFAEDHSYSIHLSAHDALELAKWVRQPEHYGILADILRREQHKHRRDANLDSLTNNTTTAPPQ